MVSILDLTKFGMCNFDFEDDRDSFLQEHVKRSEVIWNSQVRIDLTDLRAVRRTY